VTIWIGNMSISNGVYQNELEKLPISTGNPVQYLSDLVQFYDALLGKEFGIFLI